MLGFHHFPVLRCRFQNVPVRMPFKTYHFQNLLAKNMPFLCEPEAYPSHFAPCSNFAGIILYERIVSLTCKIQCFTGAFDDHLCLETLKKLHRNEQTIIQEYSFKKNTRYMNTNFVDSLEKIRRNVSTVLKIIQETQFSQGVKLSLHIILLTLQINL